MPNWHGEGGEIDIEVGGDILSVALHDVEELDNDLGAGADQDLTLALLLGIVQAVESIVEDGSADHVGGCVEEILKSGMDYEVSAIKIEIVSLFEAR